MIRQNWVRMEILLFGKIAEQAPKMNEYDNGGSFYMTEQVKRIITVMRSNGKSYNEIAGELNLPVNTVKTYCRRNRLTGVRAGVSFAGNKPAPTEKKDLLSEERYGNDTIIKKAEQSTHVCASKQLPAYKIKLEFAKQDDKTAVADVLRIMMQGR